MKKELQNAKRISELEADLQRLLDDKNHLIIVLLSLAIAAVSLSCNSAINTTQSNTNGNIDTNRPGSAADTINGPRTTVDGHGISFLLPENWREGEITQAELSEFNWYGIDGAELSILIDFHELKFGSRTIEEETDSFYRSHKEGGSLDTRLLEIDGVKGVHFLVDDEAWSVRDGRLQQDSYKFIKWSAQRIYQRKRQIIFVTLSTPVKSISQHRDALYQILNSMKFHQD